MMKLQVDPYNSYMMNPVDKMGVRSNDAIVVVSPAASVTIYKSL